MMITTHTDARLNLTQAIKIGEGKYREVFRINGYALKIIKPRFRNEYGLFAVNLPTSMYTKFKFGIEDFNQYEFQTYVEFIQRVPARLSNRFARIYSAGMMNDKSYSLSDLIVNSDGSLSRNLLEHQKVVDPNFWKQLNELENFMVDENIPLLDIRGENILVRESGGTMSPVVIDFKKYGARTYPVQFWLASDKMLMDKMKRRFNRLREQFNPSVV